MTFSIVGYDPNTEELGVAVASKFLAAGAYVPYAKAGVGAVATQSFVNPHYGPDGLALMEQGKNVDEVIQLLIEKDESKDLRQVGVVDAKGNTAIFTGKDCYHWAGGESGQNFACQGNILTNDIVIPAMVKAFKIKGEPLAERLVKALKAGEDAGGDSRGKQSAALLVVKEKGGYAGANDRYIDLRVDDDENPIDKLAHQLFLHNLYFKPVDPQNILKVERELKEKLISYLVQLKYIENSKVNDEVFFAALQSFQLIENFEERVQESGYIDKLVVQYMDNLIQKVK